MDTSIIALTCPKCGSTDQVINKNVAFGYEFKCQHCQSTSVLIINHQLYIPLPGEYICTFCGRVSDRNARFCQCGKSLIQKCINPECHREISINHTICDYCGWNQEIKPNTSDGERQLLSLKIREYVDPDKRISAEAESYIFAHIMCITGITQVRLFIEELQVYRINIEPFITKILFHNRDSEVLDYCIAALKKENFDSRGFLREATKESFNRTKVLEALSIIEEFGDNPLDIYFERFNPSIGVNLYDGQFGGTCTENEFFTLFYWVFLTNTIDKYRTQYIPICESFFSTERDVNYATLNDPQMIPFLVELMEKYPNYKLRRNCQNLIVFLIETGKGQQMKAQIEYLYRVLKAPSFSMECKEWISTAIKRIQNPKLY